MKFSLEQRALALAITAGLLSVGGALLVATPIESAANPNVFSASQVSAAGVLSPQLLAQGNRYFGQSCGDCHGDDAHGDEGPDLHNLAISNARIATTIKNGVKGEMPSFAKKYNEQQIATLVSYVRSLR